MIRFTPKPPSIPPNRQNERIGRNGVITLLLSQAEESPECSQDCFLPGIQTEKPTLMELDILSKASQGSLEPDSELRDTLLTELAGMLDHYEAASLKKKDCFERPGDHPLWARWAYYSSRQIERILTQRPLDIKKALIIATQLRQRYEELHGRTERAGKLRKLSRITEEIDLVTQQTQKVLSTDIKKHRSWLLRHLADWYYLFTQVCLFESDSTVMTQWFFVALCRIKNVRIPVLDGVVDLEALDRTPESFRKEVFYPWFCGQ